MGFDNIFVESLAQQLRHDGVAFSSNNPANWILEESLLEVGQTVTHEGFPQVGVVVLEGHDLHGAQLRDLAQDLNLATGIDTIIVRAPHATAAVSDSFTRSELEAGQLAMESQVDYAAGLLEFSGVVQNFSIPWIPLFSAIIALLVAAVIFTVLLDKR
ncbi:Rv1476 family membrane protein [Corynebacterium cystitidis]|uniref:1-deoxy-D-xylulose-5-phosphate synthase n=1 Tax=Corynebacterium cystitidis DSM 20524 TaxID=1121357 RepID=A0A1H9PLD1_9CORY|nr:DUF6676 family protein [Corynebacterium cystitidis]WJY82452.1 hypothetical protein CCYS_07645 [Corynebacterium cystitidis DSM 20524]SER49022.1 hypothetical protein SAMN05661109_00389 [Corynebacterium cystitidis DSM 20524]SNV75519.1 1-deoxy-D-xylulose-5-phosphate synthase [Corynebacterium cystitidis]